MCDGVKSLVGVHHRDRQSVQHVVKGFYGQLGHAVVVQGGLAVVSG